ncbi:MAG TPA: M23 family metallopeptidase [Polyangia bacterium]|nr:M23 family metallopeptidase [Polyangia bacterium]
MRPLLAALALVACDGSMNGGATPDGAAADSPPAPEAADAQMAPGPDARALPTCACYYGDGIYCATAIADWARTHNCQVAALAGHEGDVFQCAGGSWSVHQVCPNGCYVAPQGTPDGCRPSGPTYHVPWTCGQAYHCTQGNNGDICGSSGGDHTGTQRYAWDFGLPRHTLVRAARAGAVSLAANVVGPGQSCYDGCTQPFGSSAFWQCCNNCVNRANHVNVDHGDGTVATYWHLDQVTAQEGQQVGQGAVLGFSGTSGCSSGPHLHFMVMGNCPTSYCQSIPVAFEEAGVPACGDDVRSQNACGP